MDEKCFTNQLFSSECYHYGPIYFKVFPKKHNLLTNRNLPVNTEILWQPFNSAADTQYMCICCFIYSLNVVFENNKIYLYKVFHLGDKKCFILGIL